MPYVDPSSAPVVTYSTIPVATVTPIDTSKYITYKVQKGDTPYSIARKFNISEKQLNNYNPSLTQGMKEGQIIIVGEKNKKKKGLAAEIKDLTQILAGKDKNAVTDSSLLKPPGKPKKTLYTVALILPFRLNQTLNLDLNEMAKRKVNFPPVPELAIDMYLGFQRAVDSLKAADFNVKVELFDVDDKDTAKLTQIVNSPEFRNFDLILGPLYASGFKNISKKAKELMIPMVSPITTQNKILYNNIYISKTNPSQFTLLESLADYCIDSLVKDNANIVLMKLSEKDKKEMGFVTAFKKYYDERQRALGKQPIDTITVVKGFTGLKARYKSDVKNIVISLSSNQVFITDFTTQLSMLGDKKNVTLCGWQTITEMDNIDQEYLNQLNYVFPHQFNFTNEASYGPLIEEYKEKQQTYPGENFFIGFDIAYYYLKNLKEVGPDFIHQLDTLPMETNYMRFKYSRPDATTGFDNRGVFIFRYDDYHMVKTGWK